MRLFIAIVLLLFSLTVFAQDSSDIAAVRRMVSLSEVVIHSNLNVAKFLKRIKYDTSFYKAFKNLRLLNFTTYNDVRMIDKKGQVEASLQSITRQHRVADCRTMEVLGEKTTGDIYDKNHQWNYYTMQLYAGLFFTNGKICGETNIVGNAEQKVRETKGLDKHKEQLKMLFFNPGKKIPGIPFIGNKLDIFDEKVAGHYTYSIDTSEYNGRYCYLFSIKRRDDLTSSEKDDIVFDHLLTWFDAASLDIVARNYDLSYNAGVYDFNVHMEVQMAKYKKLLVPKVLRYDGEWKVLFRKREKGLFTATLTDFVD
jgi:hypothetical protein